MARKLNRLYGRRGLTEVEHLHLPVGPEKPRVLYFMVAYPNFSETYMHEEIRSLCDDFEIKIITYQESERPRRRSWEYERIDYRAPCLVYDSIEQIDQEFTARAQRGFISRVSKIIDEFKPDVLHCHYLGLALLMRFLAEKHQVPFTIRTHSMDTLSEPQAKLRANCQAANSPWCKQVLAFPAACQRLIEHGLDPAKLRSTWPIIDFERFYRPEKLISTGGVMCAGPAIPKKAHQEFIDLAATLRDSGRHFDLYAEGPSLEKTRRYNEQLDNPATITYADPDDMHEVYPRYDWLVYPSDPAINKVGLPVTIVEAMAAGLGICWHELPGRRQEQLDFLGGAGYLFKSIDEVPSILSRPYPEDRRASGFDAARRCDSGLQKNLLSDVWLEAAKDSADARPVQM
ncbi:MAG TPA: glycosyltransferase family 4 protein [Dehalococcoidia bacterium]|nr:glycosyltransferase family 4 protein [Dehalococcoidia bacterium]